MQQITSTPTSELDAVNTCLSLIGETLVEDIREGVRADVDMILRILRETLNEALLAGPWRFNSEPTLLLKPTFRDWEDPKDGRVLNVFVPPTKLFAFSTSDTWDQRYGNSPTVRAFGSDGLDLEIRRAQRFTPGNGVFPLVFYDRYHNSDGLEVDELRINAIWRVDYVDCPEVFKRFVITLAGKRVAERLTKSSILSGYSDKDVLLAERDLKRQQGIFEDLNILDEIDAWEMKGFRSTGYGSGFIDRRGINNARRHR